MNKNIFNLKANLPLFGIILIAAVLGSLSIKFIIYSIYFPFINHLNYYSLIAGGTVEFIIFISSLPILKNVMIKLFLSNDTIRFTFNLQTLKTLLYAILFSWISAVIGISAVDCLARIWILFLVVLKWLT